MFQPTTALTKLRRQTKRIRVIQGGTSAGKTIAILLFIIDLCQRHKLTVSIVSESMPHLHRGAIRDFLTIMREHNYFDQRRWNGTFNIYTFETGSFIEFFSADDPAKLRGARRDILFVNEANNISFYAYEQLEVRTRKLVFLDYNPVSEFWVHTEVMPKVDHDFLILTYRDNESLEPSIIASIEGRKDRPNWWRVFGEGQIGENIGQIYPTWEQIPSLPEEARQERHTVDFGFTNDPSVVVDIYKYNDELILDEVLYQTGQSNKQIANAIRGSEKLGSVDAENRFKGDTQILTVADSAEPKSISEIKTYGVKIVGSVKGAGSVNYGIQLAQYEKIKVTQRSINVIKENRNYLWRMDKTGKPMNVPEDVWNHAMDAVRYGIADMRKSRGVKTFARKPKGF